MKKRYLVLTILVMALLAFTLGPVFLSPGDSVQVSCYDGHFKTYKTDYDIGKRSQVTLTIYCVAPDVSGVFK